MFVTMSVILYILAAAVCFVCSLASWTLAAKFSRADSDLGVTTLDSAWTDRSRIGCMAKCRQRYPGRCWSVLYNPETKNCIPGSQPSTSIPVNDPSLGDLYTSVHCNKSHGFQLFSDGTTAICAMYPDVGAYTYDQASDYCKSIDSFLPTPRNAAEVNLIWHGEDRSIYWLGLRNSSGNGSFLWADNYQEIDSIWEDDLLADVQPSGDLDCTIIVYNVGAFVCHCSSYFNFFCERLPEYE